MYRLIKVEGKWQSAEKHSSSPLAATCEQILVVVFCKRKLAFVFKDLNSCNRFMLCLELLIRRAQQLEGLPVTGASFPKCCLTAHKSCQVVHEHEESGAGDIVGTTTGDDLVVRVQQLIATSSGREPCNTPRIVRDVHTTPDRCIADSRQPVLDQFVEGAESLQSAESDAAPLGRRQRGCQRQSDMRRQANTQRSQAAKGSPAASAAPPPSFMAPPVAAEDVPVGDAQASDSGSEAKVPNDTNEDVMSVEAVLLEI